MHTVEVVLAVAAGLALLMGLFTHWLRGHWVNEPVLALLLGILVGPEGLGWIDLATYGDERAVLETVADFTLAIALVSVGVELRGSLARLVRPLVVLATLGSAMMWGISGLIVWLLLDVTLLEAALIGAVLAPIDPILTATVATGRIARENLPERIRHLLSAESAIRHGFGVIFVLLPAFLIERPDAAAWRDWVVEGVLWKGAVSLIAGVLVGYVVGRLDRWSTTRDHTEDRTGDLTPVFLALALVLVAAVGLAEGEGVLAVVGAAVAFAVTRVRPGEWPDERVEQQRRGYTEIIKQVAQVFIFILLGTALPWSAWIDLGWTAVGLVIAILLLRRIPVILLLAPTLADIRTRDEALFVGWFGPIGVGALYFAAVAHAETRLEIVWTVATLIIAASIVVHDLTATPLGRWLGGRAREMRDQSSTSG